MSGCMRHCWVIIPAFAPMGFVVVTLGSAWMVRRAAVNPYVIAGIAAMAVSFFALLSLLSIANVSFAVPATAASYLIEILLARWLLHEPVDWKRWTGATMVACGVFLLAI